MARSVTFGGQTQFKPGGLTKINANALTPVGSSAVGIVGIVGEADGGAPNTVIDIDDPALAKDTFRSGPLADAIRIAFDPSSDPRIPGGAFRCRVYKTNQSLRSATHLPGDEATISDTVAAASTNVLINLVTGGLVVNAHIGRFAQISGERRRIVSNTATSITVSPAFSAAPVITTVVLILRTQVLVTSADYGVHNNSISIEVEDGTTANKKVVTVSLDDAVEQSPQICGDPYLEIQYQGGPAATNGTGTVTAATTSTITLDVAAAPGLNAFALMLIELADGRRRLIASNTAADPTVITLTAGYELTAAEATALVGQTAVVRDVLTATGSFTGSGGVVTAFTTAVTPTADNLNIAITTTTTLRQFVDQINGTTNYQATIPAGLNPDTTLMKTFDFGTRATAVDVRFDRAIDYANKGTFRRDLQVLIDWINTFATLVTAVRASTATGEGAELPLNTGGVSSTVRDVPLYLIGGARGISSNSNFQAGFDALLLQRVNHVVPLIDQDLTNEGLGSTATFDSVAAQAAAFADTANSSGKNELGAYLGYKATKTNLIAKAAQLNSGDVALLQGQLTVLNAAGTLQQQPHWSIAVAAAGMRSGAPEVGEPLTFKYIKTNALAIDSSWSPKNITDVNALIAGGVMFAEQAPNGAFRFVRDLTTYLIDDNIAFMDGNTRDAVRYVAYDFRQSLEDKFTGLKATPATVASIREYAAAKLQLYREGNIIVDSLDPETGTSTVPGWRRLRVFIEGNVATIRVEIFPVTGIVFQLNDIFLQLPRLAA